MTQDNKFADVKFYFVKKFIHHTKFMIALFAQFVNCFGKFRREILHIL